MHLLWEAGHRTPCRARGRPAGLAVDREGGSLIADDWGNTVWRVSSLRAASAPKVNPRVDRTACRRTSADLEDRRCRKHRVLMSPTKQESNVVLKNFPKQRLSDVRFGAYFGLAVGPRQVRKWERSPFKGHVLTMMIRVLQWVFRNRETGAITIAQAPNLVLWPVIVGSVLIWVWHPPGRLGVALEIVVKGGLFAWAIDEILRGVNPWRRCLGAAVLGYELTTML